MGDLWSAATALQRNGVLVFHIEWRMTASSRATATRAFLKPTASDDKRRDYAGIGITARLSCSFSFLTIRELQMQPVEPPHDCEVGFRHRARQIVDAATADAQNLRLLGDRQIVLAVDHRFALSKPALVSAPSKKLTSALRAPCGERNWSVLDCARKGAAVMILVACNPVKKHGPWVVARLRVVTPSGDPV